MLLKDAPPHEDRYIKRVPAGSYFCIRAKLRSEDPPSDIIREYFKDMPSDRIAVAYQYEDNFTDFSKAIFEIRILIEEDR